MFSCLSKTHSLPGDEVLEWNGRSLANKSYDEVHDVISESRHDSQVELRVSRLVGGASADMGRPLMVHHPGASAASFSSAAEAARFVSSASRLAAAAGAAGASAAAGHRPSVTISDPLGDTLMLNPHSANSAGGPIGQAGTRIQVGRPFLYHHLVRLLTLVAAAETELRK